MNNASNDVSTLLTRLIQLYDGLQLDTYVYNDNDIKASLMYLISQILIGAPRVEFSSGSCIAEFYVHMPQELKFIFDKYAIIVDD